MELMKIALFLVSVISGCLGAALPSCSWTQFRLKRLNEECTGLLKNMGDRMPLECLQFANNSFPNDVFIKAQKEDLVLVTFETLKGVERIFKNQHTSVTWNKDKLALFKNIIHRQVKNLRECVKNKDQTVMDQSSNSSSAILRSYFEKLEEQLKEKEFSSCGWEIVRTQMQDGLEKLQIFLERKQ